MSPLRIQIRRAVPGDLPYLTSIYNQAIVSTTATFDTEPRSLADREEWFQAHDAHFPILVAETQSEEVRVVGWASLSPWSDRCAYRETGETSFYVDEEFRGQGVGRQLQAATIQTACDLGFHTLIARVAEGSDASLHLIRSAGFRDVGVLRDVGFKFGRRLDVHVLQLMLNEVDHPSS